MFNNAENIILQLEDKKMIKIWTISIILVFIAISVPSDAQCKDQISLKICTEINKKYPEDVEISSTLSGKSLYFIYGYLKLVSDNPNVEAVKYYLEWAYNNGDSEEILSNFNTDSRWLEYDRRTNRINDYYWVKKCIYGDKLGKYVFRIYIKENDKLIKKAESHIIVKE